MENVMALISVLVGLVVWGILLLAACGIGNLVCYIQDKKHKKWCAWLFENYPELKVLLSEYRRLRTEHCNTVREAVILQKTIDEWVEKNKYLPEGRRVDKHIESLKEQYQELLDIRAEESKLVDQAQNDLIKFWENNFPDLPGHKRLMWWSE
jgi:hypothetical protein